MDKNNYKAIVYPKREIIGNVIKFHAEIKFAEGYTIIKTLEAPNDREYNPYDDAILIRAYPVLSILLKNGDKVYFEGTLSDGLLSTLRTANEYYHECYNGLGELYHLIDVTAKKESPIKTPPLAKDAVLAYSAGVDANYALLSQKKGLCSAKNVNIKTAIVLNNLEVLSSDTKFNNKKKICDNVLAHFGVEQVNITLTDEVPGYIRYMWNLSSALYLFANTGNYSTALIGSGGGTQQGLWYGSDENNCIFTNVFASKALQVREEATNISRPKKCELLSTDAIIMKNLITCFKPDFKEKLNCGYCGKCVETILCFWANGIYDIPSFPELDYKKFYKLLKKYIIECRAPDFIFYKQIVEETINSERNKYWYLLVKKCVVRRRIKSLLDFYKIPFIYLVYRMKLLLSFTTSLQNKVFHKYVNCIQKIKDDNVNIEKSYDYFIGQRGLIAQMKDEKEQAIKNSLK